ncbi:MAG: GPP34 family phosphoprotein [Chloroflexi bacterium]|nr:GPP34 family phosphoprotein [Chloroflexota bacterium]
MLRFAEEMVLLLLDDESGNFSHIPSWSMDYALAGGVLMDLALENRIDTDLERLILVDGTPIGDSLLDPALADIAADTAAGGERDARYWVEREAERAVATRDECLKRLIAAGVLEERENRFLWVFKSTQYPTVDDTQERAVQRRIMNVLLSDDIPDPRDIVIIGLADATGIFKNMLSGKELERVSERVEQVRRLDLIGQAMTQAIRDIEVSIATAVQPHLY